MWLYQSSIWQFQSQFGGIDGNSTEDFVDLGVQRQAAEEGRAQASEVLNDLILGDYEPTKSEKSFYDRKTETWETKSTTTDSGLSDENETEFFNLLEKYGGDCSDDEDGAFEDEDDEVIDDCGPLFNPVTGKIRASDDDLRQYAMTQPLCDLARAECPKGNKGRCKYGDCCGKMTTRDIWELRKKFWSFDTVKAATSSERNAKITSMLKLFYDPVTGNFNYFVSTTNLENGRRERTPVC